MYMRTISWMLAMVLAGCGSSQPAPSPSPSQPQAGEAPPAAMERKALPQQACEAQGGTVVGDIGDGATHRPDYVCPSGQPPLGNIAAPDDGPRPIEGAVCCPR